MLLVTDGQLRQTLAIVRSLGKNGIKVFVGDSNKISVACHSKYAYKKIAYPDPEIDENRFINFLLELVQKEKIEIIYPVADKCLIPIAKRKNEFEKYCRVPIPEYDVIMEARDKAKTMKIAEQAGISTPKTYYPKCLNDLSSINKFPVIIKPRMSSGSRGFIKCENADELKEKYSTIKKTYPDGLIVQDFIPLKDEISFYALYDFDSEIKAMAVQKRIRSYPAKGGPSTLRVTVKYEEVQKQGEKLLSALGWQGVAMVEFRIDKRDGQPKLMEINPRFWGSLALSIAADVNFPYLLYKLTKEGVLKKNLNYKIGIKCRWLLPGDILWFLSTPNKIKNIKSFFNFRGIFYDIIDFRDPKPIIGVFLTSLSYLFNKKKRKYIIR